MICLRTRTLLPCPYFPSVITQVKNVRLEMLVRIYITAMIALLFCILGSATAQAATDKSGMLVPEKYREYRSGSCMVFDKYVSVKSNVRIVAFEDCSGNDLINSIKANLDLHPGTDIEAGYFTDADIGDPPVRKEVFVVLFVSDKKFSSTPSTARNTQCAVVASSSSPLHLSQTMRCRGKNALAGITRILASRPGFELESFDDNSDSATALVVARFRKKK